MAWRVTDGYNDFDSYNGFDQLVLPFENETGKSPTTKFLFFSAAPACKISGRNSKFRERTGSFPAPTEEASLAALARQQ